MGYHPLAQSASTCCAFCRKPLPVIGELIEPWRSTTGLLFCNEFCADDAEEARFQNRGKPAQTAPERLSLVRSEGR